VRVELPLEADVRAHARRPVRLDTSRSSPSSRRSHMRNVSIHCRASFWGPQDPFLRRAAYRLRGGSGPSSGAGRLVAGGRQAIAGEAPGWEPPPLPRGTTRRGTKALLGRQTVTCAWRIRCRWTPGPRRLRHSGFANVSAVRPSNSSASNGSSPTTQPS
jgi:hypothetical protein